VNKLFFLLTIFFLISGCSFNKNSKFWNKSEKIQSEKAIKFQEVFPTEEALKKEFNSGLQIKLDLQQKGNSLLNEQLNNYGRFNFNGNFVLLIFCPFYCILYS